MVAILPRPQYVNVNMDVLIISLTIIPLGPLLLTWFNFNPSMDK